MVNQVVNFADKFRQFSDRWSPKIIARMNDYHFKLVRVAGDFTWHEHRDTDEVFIVLEGQLGIDFRDRRIILGAGELLVVPKGVAHKPFAEQECKLLLVEPAGTVNTGDAGGPQTAANDAWI
ncbi:MAG: cupin domain-containing protein [Candidatus Neomarinimicrobiota bacterium]